MENSAIVMSFVDQYEHTTTSSTSIFFGSAATSYFLHTDHLGSNDTRTSFLFDRGFTGHEHLDAFKIINMNGRLYDPVIARFFSPDPFVQMPNFTQNFNRYSYCFNNPLSYTDPDGEWVHLVVGAIVGGMMNWMTNGAEFSWKGLGHFGIGAAAGALGAGIGAGISSAISGAGFGAGFIGSSSAGVAGTSFFNGFAVGAGSGFSSGFTSSFSNSLIGGNTFGKSLISGLKDGGIAGGIAGMAGGIFGGIDALRDNRRFFDGAKVSHSTLIEQSIPDIGQLPAECQVANILAIDQSLGGNLTVEDVRNLMVWDPTTGYSKDLSSWQSYVEATGRQLGRLPGGSKGIYDRVLQEMRSGARVSVNLNTGESFGHSVVIRSHHLKEVTKLSGKVIQTNYFKIMNPLNGLTKIGAGDLNNALNVFLIY